MKLDIMPCVLFNGHNFIKKSYLTYKPLSFLLFIYCWTIILELVKIWNDGWLFMEPVNISYLMIIFEIALFTFNVCDWFIIDFRKFMLYELLASSDNDC